MVTDRPKPLPYQIEDVRRIEREFNGRALLSHQMGLGKTVITLGYMRRNPDAAPTVVVCPASVKYAWEYEAARFGIRADIANGQTPPAENSQVRRPSRLLIINYDILRFWVDRIQQLKPKLLVTDECQLLANRETKRTQAAVELARSIPYMLALSGTPLTNRPAELWPTLNMLRPDLYPSFWTFGCRHCRPRLFRGRWIYPGAEKLKELHKNLADTLMIRRLKADVLTDLPDKMRSVIPVQISDWREYIKARDNFIEWLRSTRGDRVAAASRAESMVKIGYLLRLTAKLKLRSVVEWVNNFLQETDEKLILFGVHRKMLRALKRRCNAKSVTVDGSVTGRKRAAAVAQFQGDKQTRLFIGNLEAAGIGLTLTAASTVGFTELGWKPATHTQAEDRPHRIGQTKTVWIHYLVAAGTIEEDKCRILQEKQKVIAATLDGSPAVGGLNVFDQLMHEIRGGFDVG